VQLTVRVKPAQKKRSGRNPATGEQITIAAKTRQRRRARPPPGTSQAGAAVGAESPPPARCLTHPPHSPVAEGGAWSTRAATTTTGPLLEYARGIRRRPRILITGASRRRSCRITLGGAEHDDHHQCGYFFQRRHRARPSFPGRPFSLCDRSRAARTDRAITSLRCRRKPVGWAYTLIGDTVGPYG